jgi:hypothetical protein
VVVVDHWVDIAAAEAAAVGHMDTVGWQVAEIQLARIAEELQVAHMAAVQVVRMETSIADLVAQVAAGIEVGRTRKGCRTVAFPAAVPCRSPWGMALAVSEQVEA